MGPGQVQGSLPAVGSHRCVAAVDETHDHPADRVVRVDAFPSTRGHGRRGRHRHRRHGDPRPSLRFRQRLTHRRATCGLSDELLDSLATFVQLVLFPSTPASALVAHGVADSPAPTTSRAARRSGASLLRQPDATSFAGGTEQTPETVQRILDAGAVTFADRGFHGTSVADASSGKSRPRYVLQVLRRQDGPTRDAGPRSDRPP